MAIKKERFPNFNKFSFGGESEEEFVFNLSLRPKDLSEFVGQKDITSSLGIALEAAKKRGEPCEHILYPVLRVWVRPPWLIV